MWILMLGCKGLTNLIMTFILFISFQPQLTKGQRYRFSLIINELKNAEVIPYMTTCLAFINTILIATEDFEERVRLRNEFAGKKTPMSIRSQYNFSISNQGYALTTKLQVEFLIFLCFSLYRAQKLTISLILFKIMTLSTLLILAVCRARVIWTS